VHWTLVDLFEAYLQYTIQKD